VIAPFVVNGSAAPTPALAAPSAPASAAVSTQLSVYPTASAHPDFLSIAVFVVIFAILLAVAYIVRVVRRRRHRWD
jgi:hypothetical protein